MTHSGCYSSTIESFAMKQKGGGLFVGEAPEILTGEIMCYLGTALKYSER